MALVIRLTRTDLFIAERGRLGGTNLHLALQPYSFGRPNMPNAVLGSGHGIDHMVIAVEDLQQAAADYAKLGFGIEPGGRHPGGTENAAAAFESHTYLELLTVYDANGSGAREVVSFLSKQEGALAVGLDTSSADLTATHLRGVGLQVRGPTGGTITYEGVDETPPILWKGVEVVTPSPYLSDFVFFIEYNREAQAALVRKHPELERPAQSPPHRNGARAIKSFWLAVDDLESAARTYASVGFPVGPEKPVPHLQATGREVEAGDGSILLLKSDALSGPVARFLESRHASAGFMGATLWVSDLRAAERALPASLLPQAKDGSGRESRRLMIPPELTHGVWIQLAEGPRKGSFEP